MELDADDGQYGMTYRHHLAVIGIRSRLQHVRQPRCSERVITARVERLRQSREQTVAAVLYRARLSVQQLTRVTHFAAEHFDDRLMSETHAERRRRGAETPDDLFRRAC